MGTRPPDRRGLRAARRPWLPPWGKPLGLPAVRGRLPNPNLRFVPRYLKYTLDQHVANDYIIVYFHCGLSSQNKPSLRWLQDAYQEFDRKCVPASPPVLEWTPGLRGGLRHKGSRQCSGQGQDTRGRARRSSD